MSSEKWLTPTLFSLTFCRASRKLHRKTLLYISGLGMAVFIFIAAELVRRTEGFSSGRNFLHASRYTTEINQTFVAANTTAISSDISYSTTMMMTLDSDESVSGNNEIYLLVSVLLYNTFAAAGIMILPWTLISELYPIEVRNFVACSCFFGEFLGDDCEIRNGFHRFT